MTPTDPQRALALSYAPSSARARIATLFALDDTLAGIVRTTREPMIGQMRLTWWYEALVSLDHGAAPPEPVLQAISHVLLPMGISGASLALMTEGWDVLLDADLDEASIDRYAADRGGRLFAAAAHVLDIADPRITVAGEGWALADLARGMTDAARADRVRALAETRFADAFRGRWPRSARSLGAVALLARFAQGSRSAPAWKIARLIVHRLAGY